jgi:uncharacterized protein (DUF58 family)
MTEPLFNLDVLRELDRLQLIVNEARIGTTKGERRSVRRGTSIEFADYRNYVRGDDLRRIDWNIYARLDRPFIKLFEEEEDLAVYLMLDCSASMNWGGDTEPDQDKFRFSQRVMAGLGYVALNSGDRLSVLALGGTGETLGPVRGTTFTTRLLEFLEGLQPVGGLDLNAAMKNAAIQIEQPGMCIVLSDLLSPNGYQQGLSALHDAGHEMVLIHVLSPDEIEPQLTGDLQLVDVETGFGQDVTIDANMRDLYVSRLLAWRDEIGAFCERHDIAYATVATSSAWDELILAELQRIGVIG